MEHIGSCIAWLQHSSTLSTWRGILQTSLGFCLLKHFAPYVVLLGLHSQLSACMRSF